MIRDLNIHECCEEHKEEMMIHYFHNGSMFKNKKGRIFLHNRTVLTCCYRMWWSMKCSGFKKARKIPNETKSRGVVIKNDDPCANLVNGDLYLLIARTGDQMTW